MNLLSETPGHWTKSSVGKYCDIQLGKMLQSNPSSDQDELKPYLRAVNISKSGLNLSHDFNMWIRPQETQRFRLAKSDILVSEGGDVGRTAIFDVEGEYYFQNAINRARPNHDSRVVPEFIFHWFSFLKASGYVEMICNVATIPHFTAEKVKAAPLAIPPLGTQQRIARFLDERTAKIDGLIEKKRELLDRLAEKRQALITRAVTNGLNSDMPTGSDRDGHSQVGREDRPAAEGLDGMNLCGEMPDNWIKGSVSKYCDVQLGKMLQSDPSSGLDELKPYLRAINIATGGLDLSHDFSMWIRPQEMQRFRLAKGDILVSEGGDAGRTAIFDAEGEYYFQNAINRVRPNGRRKIAPKFIFYWFSFLKLSGYVEMVCNVATIPHFTAEKVKAAPLAIPPIETQRRIARLLDEQTERIDATVKQVLRSIEYLLEYRSALVTSAVTGQLAELR